MSVYCPECGHVLENGSGLKKGSEPCVRCRRPLGDPRHVAKPPVVEKGFQDLFVNSIPLAVASVLAGILLIILALCVLFPVQTQQWLAHLGVSAAGGPLLFGVPLRFMETLMVGAGICALILLLRLPARERSRGRM
jgi:hypothetical protein